MTVHVSVAFATNSQCPSEQDIQHWVTQALNRLKPEATLAIRIVDEPEMREMNAHYRQKDKPTNVLSFPCQLPEPLKQDQLGDILICAPVVADEAAQQDKSFHSHFAHMVVHGVLHLLGYDHIEQEAAEKMEALESDILKTLGYPNPYGVILSHD